MRVRTKKYGSIICFFLAIILFFGNLFFNESIPSKYLLLIALFLLTLSMFFSFRHWQKKEKELSQQ